MPKRPIPPELAEYCVAVNAEAKRRIDKMNSRVPPPLFRATHIDYHASMLRWYFERGLSPVAACNEIEAEARAEARFEARVS